MKNKDLKKMIAGAFDASRPDISKKIIRDCETASQVDPLEAEEVYGIAKREQGPLFRPPMRAVLASVLAVVMFVSGILIGRIPTGVTPTPELITDATVYLDVNPSISVSVDGEDRVVECKAENSDAVEIISTLELEGVRLNTAISAIVGAMYVGGYLTDTANSILVSVDSENNARTEALLGSLTDNINTVFENSELDCSIIAQSVSVNDELKREAEENGVSVGKMHLIDKMVKGIDELTDEDRGGLSDLSINELNMIYSSHKDNGGNFDGDKHSGTAAGYVSEEEVSESVFAELGIDAGELEAIDFRLGYINRDGKRSLVYYVSVRIIGNLRYRLVVDCESGEVLESSLVIEDGKGDKNENPEEPKKNENGSPSENAPPENPGENHR